MPKRRRSRKAGPRRTQGGMLPGEARRRSLVTVQRLITGTDKPKYGETDLFVPENYIVVTRRYEGDWTHWVEYQGQTLKLPGKVVDQLLRHRESIISEQRSVRAREQAQRLAALAEADQKAAERR